MVKRTSINKSILYITGFLYFAISNLSRMFELAGIPREASYAVYLLFLLLSYIKRLRTIRVIDLVYYLFVLPYTAYGVMKYSKYIESTSSVYAIFLLYLPTYLFFRTFPLRGGIMEKCCAAAAWFSAFYLLPYYYFIVRRYAGYSMSYAYWIAFPICILSERFYKQRKTAGFLLIGIMYLSMILSGCRGALLLTTLFLMCNYSIDVYLDSRFTVKKLFNIIVLFGMILIVILNINLILPFLSRYAGISRNIKKIVEGSYLDTTTRDGIYSTCKILISAKPLGYGPLASRKLLYGHNYPHSLFYELQLDLGKYLGWLVFATLMGMTGCNILNYRKTDLRPVVNYISIVGMGSLMVSTSYYYEMYVPATVALFINHLYDKRRERAYRLSNHTAA